MDWTNNEGHKYLMAISRLAPQFWSWIIIRASARIHSKMYLQDHHTYPLLIFSLEVCIDVALETICRFCRLSYLYKSQDVSSSVKKQNIIRAFWIWRLSCRTVAILRTWFVRMLTLLMSGDGDTAGQEWSLLVSAGSARKTHHRYVDVPKSCERILVVDWYVQLYCYPVIVRVA